MTDAPGAKARRRIVLGRRGRFFQGALIASVLCGLSPKMEATMVASLSASPPSPAPVGAAIEWTSAAIQTSSMDLWYRFRVREVGGVFRMIRDYGPLPTLAWTSLDEGAYEIELSVLDRSSGEIATTESTFEIDSRVTSGEPAVSQTSHPLVFLYSSPGCAVGRARVRYQAEDGAGEVKYSPYQPCGGARSLNFYLAGLAPGTTYSAGLDVERARGSDVEGQLTFTTGEVSPDLTAPLVPRSASASVLPQGLLLQSPLYRPAIATEADGTLVWFGPSDLSLVSVAPDGTFFGIVTSGIDAAHDTVRQFDLVGMTVRETNVARVNQELAALGKRSISGFHHDARLLAGGDIAVLADVEQILTDVQGPGPIDVIGDAILVLDIDLQVVWTWDTFDHLDVSRRAVLGETCAVDIGCATHYLSLDANDWTHGNAIDQSADGNLLYSSRHQDWLIKIDYRDGEGTGNILWRLGKDGDFSLDSADPYPWFSHQHDAGYVRRNGSRIILFDNGNTRVSQTPGEASRGQLIEIDEDQRTAHLVLNADLGVFSSALGSAQQLDDGSYHFEAGFVFDPKATLDADGLSMEVSPAGEVVSTIKMTNPVYRSFRLDDLYGTPFLPLQPRPRVLDPRE